MEQTPMEMDKQYQHSIHEPAAQHLWQDQGTYEQKNNPGPLYSIDTPPPTVSGSLHIGHIFSYTQTDILARYQRMKGMSVFYPFGFDDNGLPTERFVEKVRGIKAHEMSRSAFIAVCLEETKKAAAIFKSLWQRIGLSVDWNHSYSTISTSSQKISQESFIALYKKGYVYRSFEPALYCTACRTSVAQAELDDKEVASHFNDIVFTSSDGQDLIIGTTRPELLYSCGAVLYHPHDERYKKLHGKTAIVPLFNHEVPLLEDETVDPEKGTGLVYCSTFGDKTDIMWWKKHNLPTRMSIGRDGKWLPETGILAGKNATDARATILEELKKQNLLIRQREITHVVNVHERCKKEIEYYALPQWFINVLDYKQQLLAQADQITWYPAFMKTRYVNWVENLNWNWCISRQRFFGIPFPVWHCDTCKEIILADVSTLPVDPQETPYNNPCFKCKGTTFTADTDVMDTWNTSSLTPYLCLTLYRNSTKASVFDVTHQNNFFPLSMRPQAHDIIRTWAFDTIVKTWMHQRTIPWKDIVISGHVLSNQKEKISKSKGNNPLEPENLLAQYSADAIRYWTASGNLGYDIAFSDAQIKNGQRTITKLWNAFRFAQPHLQHHSEQPQEIGVVNKWILHKASQAFKSYTHYLEQQEFGLALNHIEHFFWQDYCDNYVELVKNQLFNPQEYTAQQVTATQWTLYQVGLRILQFYAPYLPHVTEAIYQQLYTTQQNARSLHQTKFDETQIEYTFADEAALMHHIITLVSTVRKLKTEKQLSLKVPIECLTVHVSSQEMGAQFKAQEQLIRGVVHAKELIYTTATGQNSIVQQGDVWHMHVVITQESL
jgi:valyl-tRNA synthetase